MRMFWQTRDYGNMAVLGASLGGFRLGVNRQMVTRRGRFTPALSVRAKVEMKNMLRRAWPDLLRPGSPGRLSRLRARRRRRRA